MTVNIPVALRQYTQNQSDLQVDAGTVQEMLQKLDALFPGLKAFNGNHNMNSSITAGA